MFKILCKVHDKNIRRVMLEDFQTTQYEFLFLASEIKYIICMC